MKRKRLIILCAVVLLVLLAGVFSVGFFRLDYALGAKQVLESLNIDAELTENGSLRISEHWKMRYYGRGTPYWNQSVFVRKSDTSAVSDFTVYDADFGHTYELEEGATAFTAGERGSYIVDNGAFYELGWNFPQIEEGERNFTVSYTLADAAAYYADADELLYTFVSDANPFPIGRFSLNLRFPNAGETADVYAWLHGTKDAGLQLADARLLSLTANNLPQRTEVQLRLLLPAGSVKGTGFLADTAIVQQAIAEEEERGAGSLGEAGSYRYFSLMLCVLGGLLALAIVMGLIARCERQAKAGLGAEAPIRREMPGCIRPALASHLYYYESVSGPKDGGESYALSATVLSLLHKRWLRLSGGKGEDPVRILVEEQGKSPAEGEEQALLEFLRAAAKGRENGLSLEELKAYAAAAGAKAERKLAAYHEAVRRKFLRTGWVRPVRFFNTLTGWASLGCLVLALAVLFLAGFAGKGWLAGGLLLAAVLAGGYTAFRLRLTAKGFADLNAWRGFAKYLREYSLLCEVPLDELSLWGDYLVYAAAFGLSKTANAEMLLVYERLCEEQKALAKQPGGEAAAPLLKPFTAYFGEQEAAKEHAGEGAETLWPYLPFVGELAKTFREMSPRAGGSSALGRVNQMLARLGRRFGTG